MLFLLYAPQGLATLFSPFKRSLHCAGVVMQNSKNFLWEWKEGFIPLSIFSSLQCQWLCHHDKVYKVVYVTTHPSLQMIMNLSLTLVKQKMNRINGKMSMNTAALQHCNLGQIPSHFTYEFWNSHCLLGHYDFDHFWGSKECLFQNWRHFLKVFQIHCVDNETVGLTGIWMERRTLHLALSEMKTSSWHVMN